MTHIGHSEKVLVMRVFIAVLVLIFSFQSWTKADDISDFEIEGMSVGDTLLDYMNEKVIIFEINNKEVSYYYDNDLVSISAWEIRDKFKTYDDVGIILNQNDKTYKILALEGSLYFKDKTIDKCHKKQNEIAVEIENSLQIKITKNVFFLQKDQLKNDQKSVRYIDLNFEDTHKDGAIRIICYDIKDKSKDNLLYVAINSGEFNKYLDNM